jgi:enoyl-CoA hydratase/carnithine racemase
LSEAFLALFNCSLPVVAAVNEHAVAGGCILVCACGHRVMNAGHGRIGVTELLVGLPFPVTALEILRFAVGTHRLPELTLYGRTYPAAEAVGLGLVDQAMAGAPVLARATEWYLLPGRYQGWAGRVVRGLRESRRPAAGAAARFAIGPTR